MNYETATQQKEIIEQLFREIEEIPLEQQKYLLEIVKTFKKPLSNHTNDIKVNQWEIKNANEKNQAILELLDKWEAEGDEVEQTETLSYLQEVCS